MSGTIHRKPMDFNVKSHLSTPVYIAVKMSHQTRSVISKSSSKYSPKSANFKNSPTSPMSNYSPKSPVSDSSDSGISDYSGNSSIFEYSPSPNFQPKDIGTDSGPPSPVYDLWNKSKFYCDLGKAMDVLCLHLDVNGMYRG